MKEVTPPGWHCVSQCGACCYLEPGDRDELADYLSPEELATYLALVGEDGWCIHYNRQHRNCNVYDRRPQFCRVSVQSFSRMFGVSAEELPEFAAACCREHITDIYGEASAEMERFNGEVTL